MTEVSFSACETRAGGELASAGYVYRGDASGWEILRNGRPYLRLGPGYELVQTLYCGICATDLHRHRLPFALPQIGGHEAVGRWQGQLVAMDINAAHGQRGLGQDCPWCRSGLANHCPDRLTLGIDRLPGGFAPWMLVPRQGLYPLPAGVAAVAAVLAEPLAAALQAIRCTPPDGGDLAIIGAGRLGLLLLAALAAKRRQEGGDYRITLVSRRPGREDLGRRLGADHCADSAGAPRPGAYSIVYDTSGSSAGLEWALAAAARVVHLKSTAGLPAAGLANPTLLVIHELNIAAAGSGRAGLAVADPVALEQLLAESSPRCPEPPGPRGFLLLRSAGDGRHALARAIVDRGLQLHTSRCGEIPRALEFLQAQPQLVEILLADYLSHSFPAAQLPAAMACSGQDPAAIKVMIRHETASPDNS